jgi:ParB family transcriptional regulator, chromosome partitioning protein
MGARRIRYDRAAMIQKRPTLGRGLADLLGQAAANRAAAAAGGPSAAPKDEELAKLPLDLLQRGRYQPRTDLRQESLEELANSIRVQGVIQPIVVRPLDGTAAGEPQRYEIIAGERRWRAAQLAGLTEIAAVVRHIPDEAAIAVALIENIQRENLNPLEEARALSRLIDEFQMTHLQAAEAVGRSRAAVSNLLRLLELPNEVCQLVDRRELEMGHARALLGLANRRQQTEVAALVAKKGISVRETEALVRRLQRPAGAVRAPESPADPNVDKLAADVAEKLGATVAIQHATSGKGKLVISYNSLDELDGILAHIQ